MKDWLKHAFAVDADAPAEPTPAQVDLVDKLAKEVVRRHLTTPALVMLEASRPLNFLGAQALHFFAPMIEVITDAQGHRHLATFLEQRGSIDYICRRIEAIEDECQQREKNDSESESQDDEP